MPIFNKNNKKDDVTENAMTSLEETLKQYGVEIDSEGKEEEDASRRGKI